MDYKKIWEEFKESLKEELEYMKGDNLYNQDEINIVNTIIKSMENKEKVDSH